MYNLQVGLELTVEELVTSKNIASSLGSGCVDVYATPYMIALMEATAMNVVSQHLPEGYSTVGTKVNIEHLAATPIGMKVKSIAKLTHINNRALTFDVNVYDEKELIGSGTHERFIIEVEKFIDKVYKKIK